MLYRIRAENSDPLYLIGRRNNHYIKAYR